MSKTRKRLNAGDVLEFQASHHFGYLQFIGRHVEYGDAVLVSPRLQERQVPVTADVFSAGYITFYPANAALASDLVVLVAHFPSPAFPERLRRAGRRSGKNVDTWIIEGCGGDVVKTKLSEEELRLPIAAIWNHAMLVERVAEGWSPAQPE